MTDRNAESTGNPASRPNAAGRLRLAFRSAERKGQRTIAPRNNIVGRPVVEVSPRASTMSDTSASARATAVTA